MSLIKDQMLSRYYNDTVVHQFTVIKGTRVAYTDNKTCKCL